MSDRLRLRAIDGDDLEVVASVLLDARIPLREMVFDPENRRFMAAFARYRRERLKAEGTLTECTSVLVVEHVRAALWRGLEPTSLDEEHRFLTMADALSGVDDATDTDDCETPLPEPECEEGCTALTLYFQKGEAIRLTVERVECVLEDFGEPRPAVASPDEPVATPTAPSPRA